MKEVCLRTQNPDQSQGSWALFHLSWSQCLDIRPLQGLSLATCCYLSSATCWISPASYFTKRGISLASPYFLNPKSLKDVPVLNWAAGTEPSQGHPITWLRGSDQSQRHFWLGTISSLNMSWIFSFLKVEFLPFEILSLLTLCLGYTMKIQLLNSRSLNTQLALDTPKGSYRFYPPSNHGLLRGCTLYHLPGAYYLAVVIHKYYISWKPKNSTICLLASNSLVHDIW